MILDEPLNDELKKKIWNLCIDIMMYWYGWKGINKTLVERCNDTIVEAVNKFYEKCP